MYIFPFKSYLQTSKSQNKDLKNNLTKTVLLNLMPTQQNQTKNMTVY